MKEVEDMHTACDELALPLVASRSPVIKIRKRIRWRFQTHVKPVVTEIPETQEDCSEGSKTTSPRLSEKEVLPLSPELAASRDDFCSDTYCSDAEKLLEESMMRANDVNSDIASMEKHIIEETPSPSNDTYCSAAEIQLGKARAGIEQEAPSTLKDAVEQLSPLGDSQKKKDASSKIFCSFSEWLQNQRHEGKKIKEDHQQLDNDVAITQFSSEQSVVQSLYTQNLLDTLDIHILDSQLPDSQPILDSQMGALDCNKVNVDEDTQQSQVTKMFTASNKWIKPGSMMRGKPRRGRHKRGSVAQMDTPPDSGSMLPCHRRSRASSSALLRESGSLTSSPLDSQHASSWLQESQSSISSTEGPKGWKLGSEACRQLEGLVRSLRAVRQMVSRWVSGKDRLPENEAQVHQDVANIERQALVLLSTHGHCKDLNHVLQTCETIQFQLRYKPSQTQHSSLYVTHKQGSSSVSLRRKRRILGKQYSYDSQPDEKLETTLPSLQDLLTARVLRPGHMNLTLLIEDGVEVLGSLSNNGKIRASNGRVFESAEAWCREWLSGSDVTRHEAYLSVLFYREPILAFCPGHSDSTSVSRSVPTATMVRQMSRDASSDEDGAKAEIETGGVSDCSDSAPEEDNRQHETEDSSSQSDADAVVSESVTKTVQFQESVSDAETYFSEGSQAKSDTQTSKPISSSIILSPNLSVSNKKKQAQNFSKPSSSSANLCPVNGNNIEKNSIPSQEVTISSSDKVKTKAKLKKFRVPPKVQNTATSNDVMFESFLRSQDLEIPVKGKSSATGTCLQAISPLCNTTNTGSPLKSIQELPLSNCLEPKNETVKLGDFQHDKLDKQKDSSTSNILTIKQEHYQNAETRKLCDNSIASTKKTEVPSLKFPIKTIDFKLNAGKPLRVKIEEPKEEHLQETKSEEILQNQCTGTHFSPEIIAKLKAKTASLVEILDNQQDLNTTPQENIDYVNSKKGVSLSNSIICTNITSVEEKSGQENVLRKATEKVGEGVLISGVPKTISDKAKSLGESNSLVTETGKVLNHSSVCSGEAILVAEGERASQNIPEFATEEDREAWRNLTKARMFASWSQKLQAWGIVSSTPSKQPARSRPIPRYTPTRQPVHNSQESEPNLRELAAQVRDLQEIVSQLSGSGSNSEASQAALQSSSTPCQSQDLFGSQESGGGSQGVNWQASHPRLSQRLRGSQGSQEPQQNQTTWSQGFTPSKNCTSIKANSSTNFKITPVKYNTGMPTPRKCNINNPMTKNETMGQPYHVNTPLHTPMKSSFQQRNVQIKSNFEQPITILTTRNYTPLKVEANGDLSKSSFQQRCTPAKIDLKTTATNKLTNTLINSNFYGGITPNKDTVHIENNSEINDSNFTSSKSRNVVFNTDGESKLNIHQHVGQWESSSRWQRQSERLAWGYDSLEKWGDKPWPAEWRGLNEKAEKDQL